MRTGLLRLALLMGLLVPTIVVAEPPRTLPLMLVAAPDFVAERSDQVVLAEIDQLLFIANRYLVPLNVKLDLAGVQLDRGLDSSYIIGAALGPESFLHFLRSEWSERPLPFRAALGVLVRTAPGGIAGLSFSGSACLNPSAAVFYAASGVGENALSRLGATIAHEVGHLLGMEHDTASYHNGPSLMWPQVIAFSNGFSSQSILQFNAHVQRGGVACLPLGSAVAGGDQQISSTGPTLEFVGGASQTVTVAEGQELRYQVRLSSYEPGAVLVVKGLPEGAAFDPVTGELTFSPAFGVSTAAERSRSFDVTVSARTVTAAGALSLRIEVINQNQPPQFAIGTPSELVVARGKRIAFAIEAEDPDAGERLQLRYRVVDRSLRASALKGRCRNRRCELTFAPRERRDGSMQLEFTARDRNGAVVRHRLRLISSERGLENVAVTLPEKLIAIAGAGEPLVFSVGSGSGATLDIDELPPGWVLRREAERSLALYPLGGAVKGGVESIVFVARQGGIELKQRVEIQATAGIDGVGKGGGIWPGRPVAPRIRSGFSGSGAPEGALYDVGFGRWRSVACDGTVASGSVQFGGLIGDVPLQIFLEGRATRAVYRVLGEQGWWMIDAPNGMRSIPWGLKRDVPIAGDFDGDGSSDPAVFRPSDDRFYLKLSSGAERIVELPKSTQRTGALRQPFALDWDGDGIDDPALVQRGAGGGLIVRVFASAAPGEEFRLAMPSMDLAAAVQPFVADFDSDGRADLGAVSPGKQLVLALSRRGAAHQLTLPLGIDAEPLVAECAEGDGTRRTQLFLLDVERGIQVSFVDLGGALPAISGDFALFTERVFAGAQGLRPLGRLQAGRARNSTLPSFASLAGDATSRVLMRRAGVRQEWLVQRGERSRPSAYAISPEAAAFRAAGTFGTERHARLLSFSDGLWETLTVDGMRERALWGSVGDLPVPGDYNGDGITDLAIFRHSDQSWWIRFSDLNGPTLEARVAAWGMRGDEPVPGDYDGDGATDIAVFRRAAGASLWLIRYADGRTAVEQLGSGTDTPVPADYNGDGVTDLAVWRPFSGDWIVRVQATTHKVQWGLSGDTPMQGDFDGDGRADLAVWRPERGLWLSRAFDLLPTDAVVEQFGLPDDEPLGSYQTLRIY